MVTTARMIRAGKDRIAQPWTGRACSPILSEEREEIIHRCDAVSRDITACTGAERCEHREQVRHSHLAVTVHVCARRVLQDTMPPATGRGD
jgi:hypothetical protein